MPRTGTARPCQKAGNMCVWTVSLSIMRRTDDPRDALVMRTLTRPIFRPTNTVSSSNNLASLHGWSRVLMTASARCNRTLACSLFFSGVVVFSHAFLSALRVGFGSTRWTSAGTSCAKCHSLHPARSSHSRSKRLSMLKQPSVVHLNTRTVHGKVVHEIQPFVCPSTP